MSIRVLIVDDHQILRTGLSLIMETTDGMEAVGTAVDGKDGLAKVEELSPDVVLTDIRMPNMDGIAMLRALRQDHPNLPVVVLTTFDDQEPIQQALKLGAKGFLLKDADKDTIIKTIQGAISGQIYVEPSLMGKAFAISAAEKPKLNERDTLILKMVAEGSRNIDIADTLHLSERTIKAHLTEIYNQLGVFTRAEAVAAALRDGLIEL
ncbi:MAG: response regulator transcription factor [Lactobacillus sp.]|jgi:NarL family two-component system response regulator YdfI|uniref:Response regulator n=1 Tax=Lacticaseibacillus suilingensis TaxID=2799577 RepID=A0ABW4BHR5_9LACO|nr:response regulator transcription factor [Lacticaseibacillus suilingensis]MCI1895153.1 response regulator transcription factor [Lactobacillus sp.]MCI1917022.1 response regulator transcription factor [Lactobacillus sp.]MCI1941729.1 response regulator transcription factor [Lactobacillus sp.]MCI1972334.1 response regulator transcription factor [Lactobacillus sp.]MCI2017702.1 response regulator transcription factor [Lactobacillus sp.]